MNKRLQNALQFLAANRVEIAVVVFATLFLTLASYHMVWNVWFSAFLYYGAMPVAVLLVLRKNPLRFGLGLGNPRVWGPHVGITILVLAPILYWASRLPSFQEYYALKDFSFAAYFGQTCVYLLGWEYIFRGFMLFGLKDRLKWGTILVQTVPFVLLHLGKPELETLSTIFTGIYFGYVAYRGNSFWPAFIIHVFINVSFVAIVNLG